MHTIPTINGVKLTSSPILNSECTMPVADWVQYCPVDDVVQNVPVATGSWNNNSVQPAITKKILKIDTTGICDPNCDPVCVTASYEGCKLILPKMSIFYFGAPIKLTDFKEQFCGNHGVTPGQTCFFNPDGSLNIEGEPLAMDFADMAMQDTAMAMSEKIAWSLLRGDASNDMEFDGLYTQLENGWAVAANSDPCPEWLNKATCIDWAELTDTNIEENSCYPDDVTAEGKTIMLWGQECPIPPGLTLADFLENVWFPIVERTWLSRRSNSVLWEMHACPGAATCLISQAACMQPCSTCGTKTCSGWCDPMLRERFQEDFLAGVVSLYPSQRNIPVLETNHCEENCLWIGPREIGGNPTYSLLFQDLQDMLPEVLQQFGVNFGFDFGSTSNPFTNVPDSDLTFEERTVAWTVRMDTMMCFVAEMMVCAGLLVCNRHLWLKIKNVECCTSGKKQDCNTVVTEYAI